MEDKVNFMEPLFERVEEYGKTSYELLKLRALDKTAGIASVFVSRGIAILIFSIFLVTLSIGVALWLGDLLGRSYYGFFCVSGFYGVAGSVLYFFMHKNVKELVSNSIISHWLN